MSALDESKLDKILGAYLESIQVDDPNWQLLKEAIDEAGKKYDEVDDLKEELSALRAENERLKESVNKVRKTIKKHLSDKTAYKMTACHIIDEMNDWLAANPEEQK